MTWPNGSKPPGCKRGAQGVARRLQFRKALRVPRLKGGKVSSAEIAIVIFEPHEPAAGTAQAKRHRDPSGLSH